MTDAEPSALHAPTFCAGRLAMIELDGPVLTTDDAAFIQRHGLRAVCLFTKNLVSAAQVRRLVCDLLAAPALRALRQWLESGSTAT